MRHRLRSLRAQLIASFLLFEIVALALFTTVLFHERQVDAESRVTRRLDYQAATLAVLTQHALAQRDTSELETIASSMLQFPTIERVDVTSPGSVILSSSDKTLVGKLHRTQWDSFLPQLRASELLRSGNRVRGVVAPVRSGNQLLGYVWVTPTTSALQNTEFGDMLQATLWGAIGVLVACTLMAGWIARSISKPLSRLQAATQRMVRDPQDTSAFPLEVRQANETGDLILACNLMVAAIEEQRAGLNNTLSLLDSMLAHAPIGVAFFDRDGTIVRVNHFLSEMHSKPVSFFLGRRLEEVFAPAAAAQMREAVARVFAETAAVRDLEVPEPTGASTLSHAVATTWQMNIYPVRSATEGVRWAGALIVDISNRLHAEDALRKSEKLAAAGRLAASIAHEINNPLEAVTNLLYLLENFASLGDEATEWVLAAQHEVSRVSAITQQTLRFYRQSTKPVHASVPELLDSVLTLHQGRFNTLQVDLRRRYREPAELFCLTGELRQLFANLVGNALDALPPTGGRLIVAVRRSRHVTEGPGLRVTVADNGSGMSEDVRRRIFEPFFTTKEATGTGLGLWVGAEIMAKHGVTLHLRSRVAEAGKASGTVFSLFFPEDFVRKAETAGALAAD